MVKKRTAVEEGDPGEHAFMEQLEQFRSRSGTVSKRGRADDIATTAAAVLSEGGLGRFSMRLVAERCGMSLAALQYHYPSLAILLRAMIDKRIDGYVDAAKHYLRGLSSNPHLALNTHVDRFIEDARSASTARFTAQFQALACTDPYAMQALDAYMKLYRTSFAFFIRRVNPTLPPDEAIRRGAAIAGMIDGLMIIAAEGKPRHKELRGIDATIRQSVMLIVNAPCSVEG